MTKLVWKYGILAGITVIVLATISMAFTVHGENPNFKWGELLGYTSMIIALSTIFFAIRQHRDETLNGHITFGQAFKIGLFITLIAAVFYVTAWMIYSSTGAGDEMMEAYFQQAVEDLRQSGEPTEEVEAKIAEMESFKEMYKNPFLQIGVTFLEIFPVGLIVSLISAALLRRKTGTGVEVAA